MMTAKENVIRTLRHDNPEWIPVNLWQLPAAKLKYGQALDDIINRCEIDILSAPFDDPTEDARHYQIGSYTDCWGWISLFERMQYLRGTENLFMDTLIESPEYFKLMEIVEDFYNTYLDEWLKLEVDGIIFGDDWGSQRSLLISPETWRKQYKPLYKRFFDKVHTAGKFVFMHSDGYILELYDDLIEIGEDAINSQVWCMGLDKVAEKCNGRITNWGEICRQHILPEGSVEDVIDAVHKMKEALWVNGGLIGQFEAGPDMPLENIKAGLIHWND